MGVCLSQSSDFSLGISVVLRKRGGLIICKKSLPDGPCWWDLHFQILRFLPLRGTGVPNHQKAAGHAGPFYLQKCKLHSLHHDEKEQRQVHGAPHSGFFVYLFLPIPTASREGRTVSAIHPLLKHSRSPGHSEMLKRSEPAYQNPVVLAWLSRYVCLSTSAAKSGFWPYAKDWYLNVYTLWKEKNQIILPVFSSVRVCGGVFCVFFFYYLFCFCFVLF